MVSTPHPEYTLEWTERITNNEVRSRTQQPTTYCLTQSTPDAFASLVISAELTPIRITLEHCTPVLLVCPSTGGETRPAETDLITNYQEWSTATQSGSGDSSTACAEQNSLADTRGNGYVADKLRMMMMMMMMARKRSGSILTPPEPAPHGTAGRAGTTLHWLHG